MKLILAAIFLPLSLLNAADLPLGFYPVISDEGKPTAHVIFEIESKADRTISYDDEKNYDLGLEKITDGEKSQIRFKFEEIKDFLEREKHKDLIVVWFEKLVMANKDEPVSAQAKAVVTQMKAAGYKRVVILGASGFGVHYLADSGLAEPVKKQ